MRDFVYGALGRYVSPDIADQVFRNVALMRPQRREVTLCYADLEGFRRMDRLLPPEVLVELLNTYFGELTSLVRQTGGHVEYSGDALIAFWGAPVRLDRHGQVACRTALAIQAEVDRLRPGVGAALRGGGAGADGAPLGRGGGRRTWAARSSPTTPSSASRWRPPQRLERANRLYGTDSWPRGRTQRRAGEEFVFRELDMVTLGGGVETLHRAGVPARRGASRAGPRARGVGRRRWPGCGAGTSPGRWRSSRSTRQWTRCRRAGPSGCAATRRPAAAGVGRPGRPAPPGLTGGSGSGRLRWRPLSSGVARGDGGRWPSQLSTERVKEPRKRVYGRTAF